MKQSRLLDLFCGGGGLSVGARAAGFKPTLGVDLDGLSLQTYRDNLGAETMQGDLLDAMFQNNVIARAKKLRVDTVAAGVPCQGFSRLNNHRETERYQATNTALPLAFLRIVLSLRPKHVVMEEVRSFPENMLKALKDKLVSAGYRTQSGVLNASHYGVPQSRNRLFLVASLGPELKFPPAKMTSSPISAGEALQSIARGKAQNVSLTNERWVRLRERIDPTTGFDTLREVKPNWHNAAYGIINMHKPAPTLTTIKRGTRYTIMTVAEAQCLQSFPPKYRFAGPKLAQYKQIGNSVPPKLARAVFTAF